MKIGIDATSLCRKITGIEYYTLNLVKNILKMNTKNEFLILFRKKIHPEINDLNSKAKFLICPINNQVFCEQIWIPYIAIKEKVDFMHFPAFPPGLLYFGRCVFTIFDAIVWKYPETLTWKGKGYMRPLTMLGAIKAKKIITISENAKRDIVQYAHIPNEKVINAGISIKEIFKPYHNRKKFSKIIKKFNLQTKFILSVGTIGPRKNIITLFKAIKIISNKNKIPDYKLVLVGRKASGSNVILKYIIDLGLAKKVIVTGYISEEELLGLYNLADVFVCPSIYEGFGLPVLEAMACGTPVITSNTSSLPEVVNDAAILIEPLNEHQLADAIYNVLSDNKLRAELIAKGFNRVKKFSWKETSNKVIEIYNILLNKTAK
jgi:glycosyltransferase involved in cell wall biosynthesis